MGLLLVSSICVKVASRGANGLSPKPSPFYESNQKKGSQNNSKPQKD